MVQSYTQTNDRRSVKQRITEAVAKELPSASEYNLDIEELVSKWWMTGRQDGLRLTDIGDVTFQLAEIEHFTYSMDRIPEGSWYTFLLSLNRKIKCPYYLGVNKLEDKKNEPFIRLYDSKIAMLVSLYGTINDYLESIPETGRWKK